MDFGHIYNVSRNDHGLATRILYLGGKVLQAVDTPCGKDNLAALRGKHQRGILAKARRCTCDENDFIFKFGHGFSVQRLKSSMDILSSTLPGKEFVMK